MKEIAINSDTLSSNNNVFGVKKKRAKFCNKSLITNLLALLVFLFGMISPYWGDILKSIGLFALSGAITNWMAVYMLFERVPGLYGSGIIPNRFKEFKVAIKELIMGQFFTAKNIDRFFISSSLGSNGNKSSFDFSNIINQIDYDKIFSKLLEAVNTSPLGVMLQMMGGNSALDQIKGPFEIKMKEAIEDILKGDKLQSSLKESFSQNFDSKVIVEKVETIVESRLAELTPQMVKEIIQEMIRTHLGWLVVWGGVFGGALGLLAYFIS